MYFLFNHSMVLYCVTFNRFYNLLGIKNKLFGNHFKLDYQMQEPEFKPHYYQKKKKQEQHKIPYTLYLQSTLKFHQLLQ
jgi:hypothetical protein